jgi:FkbM family methyltransferase
MHGTSDVLVLARRGRSVSTERMMPGILLSGIVVRSMIGSLPSMSFVQRLVQPLTSITGRFPALHLALRRMYRALPPAIRGRRMVYDYLGKVARIRRDQTFLLVGANDGVMADHLYDHVRAYQWRGVAVEPVPAFYRALQRNYRGLPVQTMNIAVHHEARSMPLYYIEGGKGQGLPPWVSGAGSFDREQVLRSTRSLGDLSHMIKVVDVPCRTLDEIVDESGLERIDIIVIDVEGYDPEVVRRIRFDAWKTHTVIFEYKHLAPDVLQELTDLLSQYGFTCTRDDEDLMATRPVSA